MPSHSKTRARAGARTRNLLDVGAGALTATPQMPRPHRGVPFPPCAGVNLTQVGAASAKDFPAPLENILARRRASAKN